MLTTHSVTYEKVGGGGGGGVMGCWQPKAGSILSCTEYGFRTCWGSICILSLMSWDLASSRSSSAAASPLGSEAEAEASSSTGSVAGPVQSVCAWWPPDADLSHGLGGCWSSFPMASSDTAGHAVLGESENQEASQICQGRALSIHHLLVICTDCRP